MFIVLSLEDPVVIYILYETLNNINSSQDVMLDLFPGHAWECGFGTNTQNDLF